MECHRVKKFLSEYIDNTLDEPTGALIEGHLKECRDCNYEYISMKSMVAELGSMSPLEAPGDFLEKVHERIESISMAGRIKQLLFFPSWIKVPMELTALIATAVLIFVIFNMIQPENQVMVKPSATDATGSAMKQETGSTETSKGTALTKQVLKEMGPIQLTLLLGAEQKPKPLSSENVRLIVSGKDAEIPSDRGMPEFGFSTEQDQETDLEVSGDPLSEIIEAISLSEGRLISKEYKNGADDLEYITLEIPSINYHPYLEKIKDIGTLQTPVPDLSNEYHGPVQLRMHLISEK
jgi:hypothetical protein